VDLKYEIKHDPKTNETWVTNLAVVKVNTPEQVHELLSIASKNRSTAATELNARSSRSHSVFRLQLSGANNITSEKHEGILNLIDLAGSECLTQSKATGTTKTETIHINKSLTCLGDVISALANKTKHVPYRNSKLTFLLTNCLGGNSKTLMFVNVNPTPDNFKQSLSALRFATKVNSCEIGTAKKVQNVSFEDEMM